MDGVRIYRANLFAESIPAYYGVVTEMVPAAVEPPKHVDVLVGELKVPVGSHVSDDPVHKYHDVVVAGLAGLPTFST